MPAIAPLADLLCTTRPRSCGHREPAAAMDRNPHHQPLAPRRPRAGRALRRLLVASWAALVVLLVPAAAEAGLTIRNLDTSGPPTDPRHRPHPDTLTFTHQSSIEDGAGVAGLTAVNLGREKNIVLAVDHSQSMHGRSLTDAAEAARRFIALGQGRRSVRDPHLCIGDNRSRGLRGRRRRRRSTRRSHRRPAVRHDPLRRHRQSLPDARRHRNRRPRARARHRRAGDDEPRDPQERDPGRPQGTRRRLPGRDRVDLLRTGTFEASRLPAPGALTTALAPAPP